MPPTQRPGRSRQDYATPTDFFDAVLMLLRVPRFVMDLAASPENTKAFRYLTAGDDALALARVPVDGWAGYLRGPVALPPPLTSWGWLNPPFADIGPWAEQCVRTKAGGGHVAFLVPASVGSNWYRDFVYGRALVLFLNGRLAFMPDRPTWGYPKDCLLALYGPTIRPGHVVWDWKEQRLYAQRGILHGDGGPRDDRATATADRGVARPEPEAAPGGPGAGPGPGGDGTDLGRPGAPRPSDGDPSPPA